ncbi:hypothetical protein PDK45_25580 [Bacillus cereus]|nr:hypothetical protein [Bacillus cereus]
MADVPKLLPGDTLRVGYPKINLAIDEAYKAKLVSQQAENNSSTANSVAEQAVNRANNANDLSNSVQNQLNQLIIEGSIDPETKQARVEKDGTIHDTLKDHTDSIHGKLDNISSNFKSESINESAQLGPELLDTNGWTMTGWTGDFNTGFVHAVGQTSPLKRMLPATGTKLYQVSLKVTSSVPAEPGGLFSLTIGGSYPFDTYKGGGTTLVYNFGIQSLTDGELIITPSASFDGTISNMTVKEIITPVTPTLEIKSADDINGLEIRNIKPSLKNILLGNDAGKMITNGDSNIVVGHGSLLKNTSGFWNSVLGVDALANNTVGSRNIAIGRVSLQNNISGHRNVAVGTFSLNANTHGANNVGVGADALFVNTLGSGNVAIGTVSLYSNTLGNHNVSLGYPSLQRNTTGSYNIGIGSTSLDRNISGNGNVALGYRAAERVNADNNIAIGQYSLNRITTTQNSIAIGYQSQLYTTAAVNISIGANSLANTSTGSDNVALGDSSLKNNTTGSRNIAIGNNAGAGSLNSVINRNILIGHNVGVGMTTGADNNVIIGTSAGNPLTTGSNNILIGYGVNALTDTTSNHLNIGNVIKGDLIKRQIGIGVDAISAALHLKANSAEAGSAPLKFNPGTLMTTPETGAWEFDGTNLYFTINGVRKRIQVA